MTIPPAYRADLTAIEASIATLESAALDFSTTEQDTGVTWIDAKTIYRKVIVIPAGPNDGSVATAHGITDLDTVISMRGVFLSGPNRRSLPQVSTASSTVADQGIELFVNGTDVTIGSGLNFSGGDGFVILDYTKD